MGYFDDVFGSDESFLGFMEYTGELDEEKPGADITVAFEDHVKEDSEDDRAFFEEETDDEDDTIFEDDAYFDDDGGIEDKWS